jgi:uncharacterized ubiquitin-like protein YukD
MAKGHETHEFGSDRGDGTIEIVIQSTRGTLKLSFFMQASIAEVIDKAVDELGFVSGDKFDLVLPGDPGKPLGLECKLQDLGVKDGDILILTATGGGV